MQVTEAQSRRDRQVRDSYGSVRADWGLKKGLAACPGLHLSLPPSSWEPGSEQGRTPPPLTMAAQVPKPIHSTPETCDLLNMPGRRTGHLRLGPMKKKYQENWMQQAGRDGAGHLLKGGPVPPKDPANVSAHVPSRTQISAGDRRRTPGAGLAGVER